MAERIHGESPDARRNATRLYNIWLSMRKRCNNSHSNSYIYYGQRDIKVCEEWGEYLNFKKWALENGYSDELSIDRIDPNGDYCPENCKWSSAKQQVRNRRSTRMLTFNGETRPLAEWAEILKINYGALSWRINSGRFTPEEALTLPINTRRKIRDDGRAVPRDSQGRFKKYGIGGEKWT